MFDTTLGGAGARREARRTLATLPAALAVHGAALGLVVVGQLWAVEPVPGPETPIIFVEVIPRPPAAGRPTGSGGKTHVGPPAPGHRPAGPPAQPSVIPASPPVASEPEPEPGEVVPGGVGEGGGKGGDGDTGRVETPPPPVSTSDETPLRPGAGIVLPVNVERRDPVYPELARKAHREGVVIVEATIDRHGYVVDARVLRDPGLGCGAAVVEAMRDWRYRPATLNGRPVSIIVTVTVNFRLAGSA